MYTPGDWASSSFTPVHWQVPFSDTLLSDMLLNHCGLDVLPSNKETFVFACKGTVSQ